MEAGMDVRLDGMALMVTGAASGIGAAIAALAQASGAEVFGVDRQPADHVCDLADPAAPAGAVAAMLARHGRIDGLVNAAGLTTRGSVAAGSLAVWEALFAVNARAPFLLMQAALADMVPRRAGAIVNILSMNAHCGAPDLGIYAATKGALLVLTKNAANAHLRDGVRVNGINLGWVDTPAERLQQAVTLGRGEGWLAEVAARMPLGRLLVPEEAARLAVFLLSPMSAPMTGAVIDLEQKVTGA
jgi:NAD(P)-dependent dehydrogenase (short-subunit alcohol dehydrogenase family)